MIKIAAPTTSAREPRKVTDDDRLAVDGNTYASDWSSIEIFDFDDRKIWGGLKFIEGADLKWRGRVNTGQTYGDCRRADRSITADQPGFDTLAELFAALKATMLKLWNDAKRDKYTEAAIAALEAFDANVEAVRFLSGPADLSEVEPQVPVVKERQATLTVEPMREADICPDPDDNGTRVAEPASKVEQSPPFQPDEHEPTAEAEATTQDSVGNSDYNIQDRKLDHIREWHRKRMTPGSPDSIAYPLPIMPAEPEADATVTDDDIAQWENELRDAKELVCELCLAEEETKEALKGIRERRESAVSDLAMIKRNDPREIAFRPVASSPSASSTQPKPASITNSGDGEAWKNVPVDTLGLPVGIVAALKEADIDTLGKIADYTAAGKRLTDIANIGTAKAEKIENACAEYWKRNPA